MLQAIFLYVGITKLLSKDNRTSLQCFKYTVSPNPHQHLGFPNVWFLTIWWIWCYLPTALHFWLQMQLSYLSHAWQSAFFPLLLALYSYHFLLCWYFSYSFAEASCRFSTEIVNIGYIAIFSQFATCFCLFCRYSI